jgi:hypothetical protein
MNSHIRAAFVILGNLEVQLHSGIVRMANEKSRSPAMRHAPHFTILIWALNAAAKVYGWMGEPPFGAPERLENGIEYYPHFEVRHRWVFDEEDQTVTIRARSHRGANLMKQLIYIGAGQEAERDELTQAMTCFKSFQEMLDANGGYRPTIRRSELGDILAREYDTAQAVRGDDRRAYPERTVEARSATASRVKKNGLEA